MSVDERLTRELTSSTNSPPASLRAWEVIWSAATRRRQRRRATRTTSFLILLALVGGAAITLGTGGDSPTTVVAQSSKPKILASVTSADGLRSGVAVLSQNGGVERQLFNFERFHTYGAFSVVAAGDEFYATADPEAPSGLCPPGSASVAVPDVVRVSAIDGNAERLTQGAWPVVTPNGARVAYNPGSCDKEGLGQLRIMTTKTGDTTAVPHAAARELGKMRPIAWSPTGSRLLVAITTEGDPQSDRQGGARLLIVRPDHWKAAPIRINVPGAIKNATYLHDGRVLVQYLDTKGVHQFTAIEPESGAKQRLFQSTVPDAGAIGPFTWSLSADASGRVLVTYEQGELQTWAPGDAEPTTLGPSSSSAAWLPSVDQEAPAKDESAKTEGSANKGNNGLGLNVHRPTGWKIARGKCPASRTVILIKTVSSLPVPAGCPDVVGPWAVVQRVPVDLDGIDTACGPSYRSGLGRTPTCSALERDSTTTDGYPGTERRFYIGLDVLVSIHRTATEGPNDDALRFTYTDPVLPQRFPISFEPMVRATMERILIYGCAGLASDNTPTLEEQCNSLEIPSSATYETTEGSSMGGAVASEYKLVRLTSAQGIRRYQVLVEHRWDRTKLGLEYYVASITPFEGPPPTDLCLSSPPQDPRFLGPHDPCPT